MLPVTTAIAAHVDADVSATLRRYNIPGATIAIAEGGQIVYKRAYGYRNLEQQAAATTGTHYEIGSITKQFTAAAIVQLSEAEKLALDATVATYVPRAPHASEITVRQLLTQTSGLPDYFDGPDIHEAAKEPATFEQLMARIAGEPLAFAPGSHWAYSNTNYMILGKIIEVTSGERYEEYIARHILDPLGMTQTFTMADEAHVSDMATGYRLVKGRLEPTPGAVAQSFVSSAGGLVSTVGDVEKWSAALRAGRVVSPAGYVLMTTSARTTTNEDVGYGFGLFVDSIDGQPRVGHTGGIWGFTTADEYFPRQDVRILAFTNDGNENGHPEAGEMLTTVVYEDLFPEIAAAAMRSSPGEDPLITARVRTFFEQMQSGHEDYTLLAPGLASKFKARLAPVLASEFAPYGTPTALVFRGTRLDGGNRWYDYVVHFGPGVSLNFGVAYNSAQQITSLSYG